MIISLNYNIKFSSTGKQFSNSISFQPGLTVISGANEKGKSLILEMIEYAWFGAAALRGQNSDYDILNVTMEWETKGHKHTVVRNGSSQTLDKTKAVGASAVNKEIMKILGVNLDVFRIACSAKQGELDRLTARMLPTARRRMVDEIIGLNRIEIVEKLCRTEANSLRKLKDNLAEKLKEPTEPEQPSDYQPSDILEALHKEQIKNETRREYLSSISKPELPAEPDRGDFADDVSDHESLRQIQRVEREGIERTLRSIPTIIYTRSDIENSREFYRQEQRGPRPTITRDEANRLLNQWADYERASEAIECPSCHFSFVPGQSDEVIKVEAPQLCRKEIQQELSRISRWEDFTGKIIEETGIIPRSMLEVQENALAQAELRESLVKQLENLPEMEDRSEELARKKAFEREEQQYQNRLDRYLDQLTQWADNQEELKNLPEPQPDLDEKLKNSRGYEEQKRSYDADRVTYSDAVKEVDDLVKQIEEYEAGAESLKFVRSQIKQHLIPSLNRVASHLLSEMTNGRRTKINVNEDFEVFVDGQPVRTLSGSGISVVNLALRVSLGQVLTQTTLPIFLADELDADMDADRAKATHAALRKLTDSLKQILIVSHKPIEGDNLISL